MQNKVLITGTSMGIGHACAVYFLERGFEVHGIDILDSPKLPEYLLKDYHHHKCDVSDIDSLPDIEDVNYLINNAGIQDNSMKDIEVNLIGCINCTNKYGIHPNIVSIVNVASVSAHNGAEFPEYCASKGGMLAYTKNVAKEIAKYGATCNSISPGGVFTELNAFVINDPDKWRKIMDQTPLRRWATATEIAEWIYFMAVQNKSMTGQDILIDNGEMINHKFIW